MKKKLVILFLLVFILGGCTLSFGSSKKPNAGVFKSFDKGGDWQMMRSLVLPGGRGDIVTVNVLELKFDPQDNNAIYMISEENGLFYTYDGGENWVQPSQINSGRVNDLAVDPNDKCTIYIGFSNRVLKSTDCNRSWQEIYIDTRPQSITAVAVDSDNSSFVYFGNAAGEIIKSVNGGASWSTIKRFGGAVSKIVADPKRGGVFYAATAKNGYYKTTDGGASWVSLEEGLKKFSGYNEFYDLIINTDNTDNLWLVCRYGILKSLDGGASWEALNLITPPLSTRVLAFAVSPVNPQELYYATQSTFYKSTNGGGDWVTKRLPTAAAAGYLLVDPINPSIIYLGARVIQTR